jgi:SAM-dependent methyltransferase
MYNPQGRQQPAEYRLPYPDGSFDLVILGSVFTHMLPKDGEHYLSEITRVSRGGGRCLISWFLLNDESLALIDSKKSTLDFRYEIEVICRTTHHDQPEVATAYKEAHVWDLYENSRLAIKGPIHYGSWCGRCQFLSYQDLLVAVKVPTPSASTRGEYTRSWPADLLAKKRQAYGVA